MLSTFNTFFIDASIYRHCRSCACFFCVVCFFLGQSIYAWLASVHLFCACVACLMSLLVLLATTSCCTFSRAGLAGFSAKRVARLVPATVAGEQAEESGSTTPTSKQQHVEIAKPTTRPAETSFACNKIHRPVLSEWLLRLTGILIVCRAVGRHARRPRHARTQTANAMSMHACMWLIVINKIGYDMYVQQPTNQITNQPSTGSLTRKRASK